MFAKFEKIKNKPKFLIADTIKTKGVKFMEHTEVMKKINIIIGMQALRTIKIFKSSKILYQKINLLIKKEKMLT